MTVVTRLQRALCARDVLSPALRGRPAMNVPKATSSPPRALAVGVTCSAAATVAVRRTTVSVGVPKLSSSYSSVKTLDTLTSIDI